jgi:hypothetical protein
MITKERKFDHEEKDMLRAVGIDPAEYDAAVQQYNDMMTKMKAEEVATKTRCGSKYVQYMVETFDPVMMLMLQRHVDQQKYECLKGKVAMMQLLDLISS